MRCPACQYPLWNLPGRSCPECGEAFKPSQFTFTPNSVEFVCPDCQQQYYGTDFSTGHLRPSSFRCVKCAAQLNMDDMILRPAPGTEESQTRRYTLPWLLRKDVGRLRAWGGTMVATMFNPLKAIEGVDESTSAWETWRFAVTIWFIPALTWLCTGILIALFVTWPGMAGGGGGGGAVAGVISGVSISFLVWALGLLCVILPLWCGVAHLLLKMTGGSSCGIGRTMHAMSLGMTPMVLAGVPCLGIHICMFVGVPWWIVVSTIMLSRGQTVHGFRASVAVIGPALLLLITVVVLYAAMIAAVMGQAQIAAQQVQTPTNLAQSSAMSIGSELVMHRDSNGEWPGHVARLLVDDTLSLGDFSYYVSSRMPSDLYVGSVRGSTFESLPVTERRAIVNQLEAAMPPDTVAYRFGDFVIASKGITPDMSGDLWIVIMCDAPDLPALDFPIDPIIISNHDGSTSIIFESMFDEAFAAQNLLRMQEGLQPLPDPRHLVHPSMVTPQ